MKFRFVVFLKNCWCILLFRGNHMEMILFVGLPGSGKSTFYKNHYFNTHLRISNDLLRTKNRTQKLLDFCRETNMSFVIDNTCTTKEVRKRFIEYCNSEDLLLYWWYNSKKKFINKSKSNLVFLVKKRELVLLSYK